MLGDKNFTDLKHKYDYLKQYIRQLDGICIAFSAGVDSTFLLAVAHEVLKDKVVAVTTRSSMLPHSEFTDAQNLATNIGVKHIIIDADEYNIKEFIENTKNRCYYCKYNIFMKIINVAKKFNISTVADGSNIDDDNDFRPGMKAIKELGVVSPLKIAGLSKQEIRQLSKKLDLPTWDKPSFACLASRIPYGMKITPQNLLMVEKSEEYLKHLGFKQFRVRHHGDIARIEVLKEEINKMFDENLLSSIGKKFKEIGFNYTALDVEGYKTGKMNEVLYNK